VEIAAGDTLQFRRSLPGFRADEGWSLVYELRSGPMAGPAIEFVSTAQGADHVITVAAAVTGAWLAGEYVFAGYAVSGEERHQIYLATLTVTPDEVAAAADEPQKTFSQQMLEKIEAVLLGKASEDILESRVGDTLFKYLTPAQLREEHGYWTIARRVEIAKENARNGRPTGNKIRMVANVTGGTGGWGGVRPF